MADHPDIIIIGAGIIGLCIAHQISRRSDARILVIEQGIGLGEGSTGASSAVCRHRYSLDETMMLARDGVNAYRHWQEFLALDEPVAHFQNDGVLWITANGQAWADEEQRRMNKNKIRAEVLDGDELKKRFPALSSCTIEPDIRRGTSHNCVEDEGFLYETDGGFFDPMGALTDLHQVLKQKQIEVRFQSKVTEIIATKKKKKVKGVKLLNGDKIDTGCVINASGPWCNEVYEMLGMKNPWPLMPTRIQVIHLDKPPELIGKIPVTCDLPGGIYFREQNRGQQLVIGSTREEDEREVVDPSDYNNYIDDDFKQARLHALHHRIPALPYRGNITGYTGLYTVNQADVHPVVGKTPIDGFYVANGFSGHGFKLAPAIGSLLAQEITSKKTKKFETSVSPEFLAFDREPLSLDTMNVLA